MATASAQVFFERYKQLNSLEQQKDGLIEDLLQRVNELEEAFRQEKLDHERETRFNRDIQIHEMELMQHISRIKNIMDREPFIIVLLDGDGIIFKDEFLREGERGGRDAANQLSTALDDFVTSNFPSITSPKIMMRIYANIKGLSELCVRAGIISEQSLFYDFIRGFNNSTALFDYVDVGTEKGSANDKIGGMRVHPSLFLALRKGIPRVPEANILLGCSHDDGYIQILENTLADMDLTGRVSLIEGTAFEKDMESIKASYRITKFPDIFRDTKITTPVWAPWKAAVTTAPPKPQSVLTPSPSQYAASLTRRSANSTPSNNSRALSSSSLSTSQNSSDFQVVPTKASKQKPPKTVERNKYGQRVDRLDFRSIPREDLNRIKKMKLCNYHFLLGECPNTNCYHDHTHKLTKDEYYILTAIARMTPCHWGLDCDDPECIYGHRCPQSEPGRKDCYWGSNCRFDTAAHGIDTNIVKVTKV